MAPLTFLRRNTLRFIANERLVIANDERHGSILRESLGLYHKWRWAGYGLELTEMSYDVL